MKRLLKIEWIKLVNYKTAKIFTLIYFAILVIIGAILALYKPEVSGIKLDFGQLGMFNFPVVWHNMTFTVGLAKVFIALIIINNVTNEFTSRTLKQNLIDGLSKGEFLKSKIMTNTILAFISTIFVFVIALVLGLIFSSSTNEMWKGVEYVGAYFLKLSLFFSLCLFVSILFRRSGFAFLSLIILWFIEKVISVIDFMSKTPGVDDEEIIKNTFYISDYLPLNTGSNLINFPNLGLEGFIFGTSAFNYSPLQMKFVVASVVYIAVFTFLSYRILKKRDL